MHTQNCWSRIQPWPQKARTVQQSRRAWNSTPRRLVPRRKCCTVVICLAAYCSSGFPAVSSEKQRSRSDRCGQTSRRMILGVHRHAPNCPAPDAQRLPMPIRETALARQELLRHCCSIERHRLTKEERQCGHAVSSRRAELACPSACAVFG